MKNYKYKMKKSYIIGFIIIILILSPSTLSCIQKSRKFILSAGISNLINLNKSGVNVKLAFRKNNRELSFKLRRLIFRRKVLPTCHSNIITYKELIEISINYGFNLSLKEKMYFTISYGISGIRRKQKRGISCPKIEDKVDYAIGLPVEIELNQHMMGRLGFQVSMFGNINKIFNYYGYSLNLTLSY